MNRIQTEDLAHKIGEQRDRLTESAGALADKIDVSALTDKIDTDQLRARAEAGATTLLDNATDSEGNPKRGVVLGLALALLAVLIVRRVTR